MTDKELRKLKRDELLEILFYLQKEIDELKNKNEYLNRKVEKLSTALEKSGKSLSKNDLDNISEVIKSSLAEEQPEKFNATEKNSETEFDELQDKKPEKYVYISDSDILNIVTAVKNTVINDSQSSDEEKRTILSCNEIIDIIRKNTANRDKYLTLKYCIPDEIMVSISNITANMYKDYREGCEDIRNILIENDVYNMFSLIQNIVRNAVPEEEIDVEDILNAEIQKKNENPTVKTIQPPVIEVSEKIILSEADTESILAFVKQYMQNQTQKNTLSESDLESISQIVNGIVNNREKAERPRNTLSASDLVNIYGVIQKALKKSGGSSEKGQIRLQIMHEQAKRFFEGRRSDSLWQNKK